VKALRSVDVTKEEEEPKGARDSRIKQLLEKNRDSGPAFEGHIWGSGNHYFVRRTKLTPENKKGGRRKCRKWRVRGEKYVHCDPEKKVKGMSSRNRRLNL